MNDWSIVEWQKFYTEGVKEMVIPVFQYLVIVAFSHCTSTVIGPVRISSSRYIVAMLLVYSVMSLATILSN